MAYLSYCWAVPYTLAGVGRDSILSKICQLIWGKTHHKKSNFELIPNDSYYHRI